MPQPLISVIAPVHNEEMHLHELTRRLTPLLREISDDFEIVYVNDGSSDRSVAIIEELHAADARIVLVDLARNFGKELAMLAGYDHAHGQAVVVIDSDLQTPPELIPEMVAKWRAGAQIVDAVRQHTEGQGPVRRSASIVFYWVMQRLANTQIVPNAVDFRLLDQVVVRELRRCRERHRFNRGLVSWVGFKRDHVTFVAADRADGASRWSVVRLFGYALDGVLAFSSAPLRVAGVAGLMISFLSLLYLVFLLFYRVFVGQPMAGYATIVGGIFLLGGVQLLTIWLLGEYVGRIYEEIKQRPLYITARVLRAAPPSETAATAKRDEAAP